MPEERSALTLLKSWKENPGSSAVFTDIDGTLAPIVPTPYGAKVPQELRETLRALDRQYLIVAGISGRSTRAAREIVGLDDLLYFGNHGFEILRNGKVEVVPEAGPYLEAVKELERRAENELAPLGAFVEEKGITASIHYRNVPEEVGERCREFVQRESEQLGLEVMVGRGIVEARPPVEADKGTAVRRLVRDYRPERALFIGDDTTDLDAFHVLESLRGEGELLEILRVGVESDEGPPEITAEADLVVEGVEGVGEALQALLEE